MSPKAIVLIVALALLAAVSGSIITGWVIWSGRIASDVSVTWSLDSPRCEGTTVKRTTSKRPVIEARETMRCVVTVEVVNRSGRAVHADQAVAPVVGPRTGAVVTAENAQPAPRGGPYDIDAQFPIDRDVPPGESISFDIVLVFHPSGCNDSGTLGVSSWPTVTVDVLGRSYDRHGDKTFAFRRDGKTPGCQRM